MPNLSPIVLFTYNRLAHTRQTVESLQKNILADKSELIIYSDSFKTENEKNHIDEVRKYLYTIKGFSKITIIEREKNMGLAASVISGVTEVIKKFEKVIVIEDDLICSQNFLEYINQALNFYESDKRIFSIAGYSLPINIPSNYKNEVYLSYRGSSWGWGTWKDRWETIDWEIKDKEKFLNNKALQKEFENGGIDLPDMLIRQLKGEINSWAIRFAYSAHKQNKVHLIPTVSKIQNIGQDQSGTHSAKTKKYDVIIDKENKKIIFPEELEINKEIIKNTQAFFKKSIFKNAFLKIINLLK